MRGGRVKRRGEGGNREGGTKGKRSGIETTPRMAPFMQLGGDLAQPFF